MLAAIDLTRSVRLLALLGLGAVLIGLASLCMFTVDAGEYAVVTQFGKPVRVEHKPGLKFKLPAPVQTVSRFDRRLFVLVPPPREFLTLGKNAVVASGFIVWRVHDPKRRSEEHTSELQSQSNLVCRLLLEKKKKEPEKEQQHDRTAVRCIHVTGLTLRRAQPAREPASRRRVTVRVCRARHVYRSTRTGVRSH